MDVLKEVLEEIKPKDSKIKKESDDIVKKINLQRKKDKLKATAVKGGSVAKDIYLDGDCDCDIFVKFHRSYDTKEISKLLYKILKKIFKKINVLHGSRDYYSITNGINYEIVPVIDIKKPEEAKNITDCSPLHSAWVKKHAKYKDDIRLAKAFAKSAKVYGAESYVHGFSGHVIDILTIYYKGFKNLLKASLKWKSGNVIDFHNYHHGRAKFNLNESKINTGLIVIDPIEPDRNAAAALNAEQMDIFKKRAKEFLKKPSKKFFLKEIFSISSIKYDNKKYGLIVLDVITKKGNTDVIGAKILKLYDHINSELSLNDFEVKKSGWVWDKDKRAIIFIVIGKKRLPEFKEKEGPPVSMKEACAKFKKKNKNIITKNKRLYAKSKRVFREPIELIKKLMKEEYPKIEKIQLRK